MGSGDAARASLRGIYAAGPGLRVERSLFVGRTRPVYETLLSGPTF